MASYLGFNRLGWLLADLLQWNIFVFCGGARKYRLKMMRSEGFSTKFESTGFYLSAMLKMRRYPDCISDRCINCLNRWKYGWTEITRGHTLPTEFHFPLPKKSINPKKFITGIWCDTKIHVNRLPYMEMPLIWSTKRLTKFLRIAI